MSCLYIDLKKHGILCAQGTTQREILHSKVSFSIKCIKQLITFTLSQIEGTRKKPTDGFYGDVIKIIIKSK